jgi:hypothetical protein
MTDDAGRIWHNGNTDDAGRLTCTDVQHQSLAALVVTVPQQGLALQDKTAAE